MAITPPKATTPGRSMFYLPVIAAAVQPVEVPPSASIYAAYIEEAAQKSGLPAILIRTVMGTESAGNIRAISPKGAMGLMQLMPRTWEGLRRQFNLGSDPFDPHDNILAGAYYLRALYDTYGPGGFLAAYNAGPGRWKNHRDTGQPLPAETRAYVVAITQKLGPAALNVAPGSTQPRRPSWMEATLFLTTGGTEEDAPTVFVAGPSPFVSLPAPAAAPTQETGQ